jgi:uncharacterized CHY-type Zn-finger protein
MSPGCGKAFSQLSNLQSHSRSHMTDKPFRCNSCYKCYSSEQGLREHIPKHSETKHLKTHICHLCGKSYTQETYLTRHMGVRVRKRRSRWADHISRKLWNWHKSWINFPTVSRSILWPFRHSVRNTTELCFYGTIAFLACSQLRITHHSRCLRLQRPEVLALHD